MHGLRPIGREHRVFGGRCLNADLETLDVLDFPDLPFRIHVAQAEGGKRDNARALNAVGDHRLAGLRKPGIGHRLDEMIFRAEKVVQRHDAGLRRHCRGVRRRRDAELDVAGFHELKHLRLLSELRARILIDQHGALAQVFQLVGKDIAEDAVPSGLGLVIGKAIMLHLLRARDVRSYDGCRSGCNSA